MITNEEKFFYEQEEGGIISTIPFDYSDFYDILRIWTSNEPYRDFPSKTIQWRLMSSFENKKLMMFRRGINSIGFASWGWMTEEEYETINYSGDEIFSRDDGDLLVIADLIIEGGKKNVETCIKHLRNFGKNYYPEVDRIYFHRLKGDQFLKISKSKG